MLKLDAQNLLTSKRFALAFALVALLIFAWVGVGMSTAGSPFALVPGGATLLHAQGFRHAPGTEVAFEAWLDLTNNEGKIVEATPDGSPRQVQVVTGATNTLYLADAHHVVIRRNFNSASPFATQIRDRLLRYRVGAERGFAQVVGTSLVNGRQADRIQLSLDGSSIVADVDHATGLVLREEFAGPDRSQQTIETTYSLIEYVQRSAISDQVFQIDVPADVEREEYSEGDAQAKDGSLSYRVYAAPASTGQLVAAFRRFSTAHGHAPSDAFYLIYRAPDGESQVISGSRPDLTAVQVPVRGALPTGNLEKIELAGKLWDVEATPGQFRGSADLGDAFVTIFAPDRSRFERIAGALTTYNK